MFVGKDLERSLTAFKLLDEVWPNWTNTHFLTGRIFVLYFIAKMRKGKFFLHEKGKVHLLQLIEWGEVGGAGMVGCKDRSALTQVQRFIASFMNLILNICFNYGLETNTIAVCQDFSFLIQNQIIRSTKYMLLSNMSLTISLW